MSAPWGLPYGTGARHSRLCFGICVFSGCLYAMALGAPRWLGAVVPLGGAALLIGWVFMALAVRHESD